MPKRSPKPAPELPAWLDPDYNAAEFYAALRNATWHCWACFGRSSPKGFFGPWLIERAHMANKPRREDARLVVMLCTLCHKATHGERVVGFLRPKLELGSLLAIKQEWNPSWFDLEFIQKHSVRVLPEVAPLPEWYFEERIRNGWRPM